MLVALLIFLARRGLPPALRRASPPDGSAPEAASAGATGGAVITDRRQTIRDARRAAMRGERPRYRVNLAKRTVEAMPWLEFDGRRPEEILEAARRSIASELGVLAHEIEVEPA